MTMTDWHKTLQSLFQSKGCETEVKVSNTRYKNYRICDVVNAKNEGLEIQHSPITKIEIEKKSKDYVSKGHSCIYWLIDGTDFVVDKCQNDICLVTLAYPWTHLDQIFSSCPFVFSFCVFEKTKYIMKLAPTQIRNQMVYVQDYFLLQDFVDLFSRSSERVLRPMTSRIKPTLTLHQKPAGSGKTYGLILKIIKSYEPDAEFSKYGIFIILTKPHSAKDVVRREMEEQLRGYSIDYEQGDQNNAPWFLLHLEGKEKLIILATGDSFVCSMGEKSSEGFDLFEGICKMILTNGPTKLKQNGTASFKGHRPKINAQSLIVVDEATKFRSFYAEAICKIMTSCLCDAYIIADKIQSVEHEHSLFSELMKDVSPFLDIHRIIHKENEIRRFGKNLVKFLVDVTGKDTYIKYGLPVPITCQDREIKRDNEGEIEVRFLPFKDETEKAVNEVIAMIESEMYRLHLLPNDILIVLPFVSVNPFADFLRDKLDDAMLSLLEDDSYRQLMLSGPYQERATVFFRTFDGEKEMKMKYKDAYERNGKNYSWCAYLHRSEYTKPIATAESDNAVRMVSIHAAQGDGRRLAITCQLSEPAFKRYTEGKKNLQYDSLLQVSCSRAKTKQIVLLQENNNDDIIRRFRPYCKATDLEKFKPSLFLKNSFRIEEPIFESYSNPETKQWINSILDIPDGGYHKKDKVVEGEHFVIRNSIFQFSFLLNIYQDDLVYNPPECSQVLLLLEKISKLPIQLVSISEFYKILDIGITDNIKSIPIMIYKGKEQTSKRIYEECKKVQQKLKKIVNTKSVNVEDMKPIDYIFLWYMYQLQTEKKFAQIKMQTLVNIYLCFDCQRDNDIHRHYQYIGQANAMARKIISSLPEHGKWNVSHYVTLGNSEGAKFDDFSCGISCPFVYTTEHNATAIHVLSNITSMRKDEIATKVFLSGLFMTQAYQDKKKPHLSGRNKERFDGKELTIKICSIEESDNTKNIISFEWSDIKPYRSDIVDVLVNYIYHYYKNNHQSIREFIQHWKDKSYYEFRNLCKNSRCKQVDYVRYVIQNFAEEYEDHADDLMKYVNDTTSKLDKKLQKMTRQFVNFVLE